MLLKRKIKTDTSTFHPFLVTQETDFVVKDRGISTSHTLAPFDSSTYLAEQNDFSDLNEKELTAFTMQASEQSLAKVWEDEDDNYWESFL